MEQRASANGRWGRLVVIVLVALNTLVLAGAVATAAFYLQRNQQTGLERLERHVRRLQETLPSSNPTIRTTPVDSTEHISDRLLPDPNSLINEADRAFREQRYESAFQQYAELLRNESVARSFRAHVLLQLGECCLRMGRYAEAVEHYRRVSEEAFDPAAAAIAQFRVGEALFQSGNYAAARRAFYELLAVEAAVPASEQDLLARALYRIGDAWLEQARVESGEVRR